MRIVMALLCTFLLSLTLPSLSFAGSNCDKSDKNCFKNNGNQKGKGNCNENGNCEKAKDKANNDDYSVDCREINNLVLRRECLERRRD
ncbi:hypothetical protein ACVW0Y_003561 [Pseudomonas sp. TE3786]